MAKKKARSKPVKKAEHVKHISYDYDGRVRRKEISSYNRNYNLPLGIKVLIGYLGVLLFFYISYFIIGLKVPLTVLGGQIITGTQALLTIAFLIFASCVLIYGLWKRKRWSYYLCLIWFAIGIANSVISLIFLGSDVLSVTRNLMILSSVTVFLINTVTIAYIYAEKKYFFAHSFLLRKPQLIDKAFVSLMCIFVFATLLVASFIGYDFYKTNTRLADGIVNELDHKTDAEQMEICSSKNGAERDTCYIVAAIKQGSKSMCDKIGSDFYKFTCLRAV